MLHRKLRGSREAERRLEQAFKGGGEASTRLHRFELSNSMEFDVLWSVRAGSVEGKAEVEGASRN